MSATLTTLPPAPSTRHPGIGPVTAVSLAQAGGGFVGGATGPYIVLLALHLQLPAESLGWIASAFGAALIVVAFAGEWLLRINPVMLLRVSAVTTALGCLALATANGLAMAAVGAALTGLGGAANVVATSTLLSGAASRMSLVTAVSSATGLVAPPIMGALVLLGVPGTLALLLPIPLLLALAAAPMRAPDAVAAAAPVPPATAGPVRLRPVIVAWLALVLAVAAEFCFFIWGVARLVDSGVSEGLAAVLGVAFPLGMVIGRSAGARMAPAASWQARRRLLAAAVVTAIATLPVVFAPGVAGIAAGLFVAGLGLSVTYPLAVSLIVAVPGLLLRRAAAIGASGSGVAIIVAPVALAALAGVVDLRWAFLLPLPLLGVLALTTLPGVSGLSRDTPHPGEAAEPAGAQVPAQAGRRPA